MSKWLVWFEAMEVEAITQDEAIFKAKTMIKEKTELEVEDILCDEAEDLNKEINVDEIIKLDKDKGVLDD